MRFSFQEAILKILNFGSLNIDRTYEVVDFVTAGQTVSTANYQEFSGGKGLNQSIALARAGGEVYHIGVIGHDGAALRQALVDEGVDTRYLKEVNGHSGHTVIQIDHNGENCILFEAGSNALLTTDMIDQVFDDFKEEEVLVLVQNEVSNVPYIIQKASDEGHQIAFNPSPMNDNVFQAPLDLVNYFLINEGEGQALTQQTEADKIEQSMHDLYPSANVLLTLGEHGSRLRLNGKNYRAEAVKTQVVDTTAAGDTFTGYFLAGLVGEDDIQHTLDQASLASSLAIAIKGAVASIPLLDEVKNKLKE